MYEATFQDNTTPTFDQTGERQMTHSITKLTRVLLICGLVAGPFYIVVGLIQALTRPGFDLLRHDLSLLANGDLGWIQITNLVLTGLLVVAFAVGLRRALPADRAHPGAGGHLPRCPAVHSGTRRGGTAGRDVRRRRRGPAE